MKHEIEEIWVGDRVFSATVELEVECGDDGIGSYEFWGTRGYDSQPYCMYVIDEITEVLEWIEDGDKSVQVDYTSIEGLEKEIQECVDAMEVDDE